MICFITSYLFFHSIHSIVLLLPAALYLWKRETKQAQERTRRRLEARFKDGLQSLQAAMEAGYSVENAFAEAERDLRLLYSEQEPIAQAFGVIVRQLQNGSPVEAAVTEFAARSQIAEIQTFAETFCVAKRSGGNLLKVLRRTTQNLYLKAEVEQEIATAIAAKQAEFAVMKVVPYGILIYFHLFSPSFLQPLYEAPVGKITMLAVFVLYGGCLWLADHMADISY